MDRVNVLVEAKKEYTSQLQKILTPKIYEGFKSIYEDIIEILNKELEENKVQSTSLIKEFQKTLKDIPQWNHDIVINEYNRIEKVSNCDYLEDLIEAVFITNTQILTSVQINNDKPLNIKVSVPQPSHFIHKCYIECAKEIYKNPYIFDQSKNIGPKEKHNNLREALTIIDNGINNSIRELLPIRDILKQGITKVINNKNIKEITKEETDINETTETNDENDEITKTNDETNQETDEETNEQTNEQTNEENNDENNDENNEITKINEIHNLDQINKVDSLNNINENNKIILDNIEDKPFIYENKPDLINRNIYENDQIKEIILSKSPTLNIKKFDNIEKVNNENLNYQVINKDINNNIEIINDANNNVNNNINNNVNNNVNNNDINDINNVNDKTLFNTIANNNSALKNNDDISNSGIMYKKVVKSNPFIKTIKNNKFIKNRLISGGNSSFYKKKYEENSANYNSINTLTTEVKEHSKLKNQIILDERSDDEEELELDI
jgi:hypothetical protein